MRKFLLIVLSLILSFMFIACKEGGGGEDQKEDLTKVNEVIELINNIEEPITLNHKSIFDNIDRLYNDLGREKQSKVTNYDKFLLYKEELNKLVEQDKVAKDALNVDNAINALKETAKLTLADKANVEDARSKYEALSAEAKKLVTKLDKLVEAENRIALLEKCKTFQDRIDIINVDNITINDKELVNGLYNEYNALTDEEKDNINISKLTLALEKISDAEVIEGYKEKAQAVIDLIDGLPSVDNLTLSYKSSVTSARNRFKSLASQVKPYVTNLAKLEALEAKITELEKIKNDTEKATAVDDQIKALPSVSNLVLDDASKVNACVNAYNALTADQKALVKNYATLTACVDKIAELNANKDYVVTYYLNGGTLPGASGGSERVDIATISTQYYSTGYWDHYETDVIVFKSSLIGTSDLYTSAWKVGFSYNSAKGLYVVDQIINNSTALSTTTKAASEYFIFVNASNANSYYDICNIELGMYIEANGSFPTSATSSASITLKAYKQTESSITAKQTFKGINTLGIPTKSGYDFLGWYDNASFSGNKITTVSDAITLYASWTVNKGDITTDTILNCVSDVVNSDTIDILLASNDEATFTWSSSNSNLYKISNGVGKAVKQYQTHQTQSVTVTCNIKFKSGTSKSVSKTITIGPVKYDTMPSTPIATYFATSAASSYKKYNQKYLSTGKLFSQDQKDALDIVYYAFIEINADGTCKLYTTSYVDEITELKNYNVRIVASISGTSTTTSQYFTDLTADTTKCAAFAKNLMDLCDQYRFDGLDIDWESTSGCYVKAAGMNNLCKALKEEMTKRQASGGSPYLMTAAIPASSWGLGADRYDFKTLNNYLDYINIMSYDANKSDVCSHLCPLYSSSKDNGYGFGGVYGVNQISAKGFDKNKLIVGCAGYGKAYQITSTSVTNNGLGCSGKLIKIPAVQAYGSYDSGTLYGGAINALIATGKYVKYDEYVGSNHVGSYLYNAEDKIFVTYDSSDSIRYKYEYATKNNVGLMCWAYTEDTADNYINTIANLKKGN